MSSGADKKYRISQEAFDDIIKENMEDFDMELEEAITDALKQLKSQKTTVDHLITDPSILRTMIQAPGTEESEESQKLHPVIESLKVIGVENENTMYLTALETIATQVKGNEQLKTLVGNHKGIDSLVEFLMEKAPTNQELVIPAIRALTVSCSNHLDNKNSISKRGMEILTSYHSSDNQEVQSYVLSSVKTLCTKHESNKTFFKQANGVEILLKGCEDERTKFDQTHAKLIANNLRLLTINDDPQADFSQAHDIVRELVDKNAVEHVFRIIELHKNTPEVLAAWFIVMKQLAITEDNCNLIVEKGGLTFLQQAMKEHAADAALVKNSISVFRNIVAADRFKDIVVETGSITSIVDAMDRHQRDRYIQEYGCATFGAVALRRPDLCTHLVNSNIPSVIVRVMNTHKTSIPTMRQCSLAIRNLVARNPELREQVLSNNNLEDILREIIVFRGCGDEAYAALRDLGCEIQLYENNHVLSFNPTTKQSRDLNVSVSAKARAPFAT